MWRKMILLLSGFGLLSSGCTVHPAAVAVTPPAVVVPAHGPPFEAKDIAEQAKAQIRRL